MSSFDSHLHPRSRTGQFVRTVNDQPRNALTSPPAQPDRAELEETLAEYETPRSEDIASAEHHAIVDIRNSSYPAKLTDEDVHAQMDPSKVDRLARHYASVAAPGRMFRDGVPHPNDDHFDAIWAGEQPGFSEQKIRDEITLLTQMKADLASGVVKPRQVIGTGYRGDTRKLANDYLDESLTRMREGFETRGRSLGVNVANVNYARRRAQRAASDE